MKLKQIFAVVKEIFAIFAETKDPLTMEDKEFLIMKKLFLFFIFCLSVCVAKGQQEHLKFMGVPLQGNMEKFLEDFLKHNPNVKALEKENDSTYICLGKFYKFQGCEIRIKTHRTDIYNQVASASVTIDHIFWDDRKKNLANLVDDLNLKYGYFDIVDEIGIIYRKMRWTCNNGIIQMSHYTYSSMCILEYIDYIKAVDVIKKDDPHFGKEYEDL